ncbi:tubulin binding cofactor A [Russula dissimulans]|nr:tubulin binding cofactor A [Russula dissimulans]
MTEFQFAVSLPLPRSAMSDTAATRKQLKIKASVVKRYQKDLAFYCAEVVENERKLKSITADGGKSWDVKNAANLVRESENMVRDTTTRLERAAGELEDLLNSAKRNAELEQDPELREAEAVLVAAK